MKPKPFLLFAVPLLLIKPCSATRTLFETVRNTLYSNAAFPAPSEELLRNVRSLADDYEAKILKNLRQLSVASMRDLLAFLRKDALSLEEVLMKIETDGYQNASGQQCQENVFCFHHLSRWSFGKLQNELRIQPTDTSEKNFRYLSETTVKVFLEAESLFQEYVRAFSGMFNMTDETREILRNDIRSFYNLKKSEMLYNELYRDPWYLAAKASEGAWSTVLYSILEPSREASQAKVPPPVKFNSAKAENFINSVTENFNKCVDASTADESDLKQNIKRQFRTNCIEYLLRGIYAYRDIPSPEKNALVNTIFEYARKISEGSESQPPK